MSLKAGIDKVIVLPDPKNDRTESGLILTNTEDKDIVTGRVIDQGVGSEPTVVYTNCKVYFHRQTGVEIVVDKVKYFVVDNHNILAYIGL